MENQPKKPVPMQEKKKGQPVSKTNWINQ